MTRYIKVSSSQDDDTLDISWKKPFSGQFEHKNFIFEDGFGRRIILDAALSNHVLGITLEGFGLDPVYGEFVETEVVKIPFGTEE